MPSCSATWMTVNLKDRSGDQRTKWGAWSQASHTATLWQRAPVEGRKNVMKARPSHVKARQASKIREIGDALIALGYLALDEQAKALGLARSTVWTILRADHKNSGLSATVINRMLAAPHLPPLVRAIILEHVEERVAGLYGHSKLQFCADLPLVERSKAAAIPE
jgi:hypothetical protein